MLSLFSFVQLFATLWNIASQGRLSMNSPGVKPESPTAPAFQVEFLLLSHQGSPIGYLSSLYLSCHFNSPFIYRFSVVMTCSILSRSKFALPWITLVFQITEQKLSSTNLSGKKKKKYCLWYFYYNSPSKLRQ